MTTSYVYNSIQAAQISIYERLNYFANGCIKKQEKGSSAQDGDEDVIENIIDNVALPVSPQKGVWMYREAGRFVAIPAVVAETAVAMLKCPLQAVESSLMTLISLVGCVGLNIINFGIATINEINQRLPSKTKKTTSEGGASLVIENYQLYENPYTVNVVAQNFRMLVESICFIPHQIIYRAIALPYQLIASMYDPQNAEPFAPKKALTRPLTVTHLGKFVGLHNNLTTVQERMYQGLNTFSKGHLGYQLAGRVLAIFAAVIDVALEVIKGLAFALESSIGTIILSIPFLAGALDLLPDEKKKAPLKTSFRNIGSIAEIATYPAVDILMKVLNLPYQLGAALWDPTTAESSTFGLPLKKTQLA